jgi:hypothetical protein
MASAALLTRFPQVGVGGCGPRPRNSRPLCARIETPATSVAWTTTTPASLERTCRHMIPTSLMPLTRATSMYCSARTPSTTERTTLATGGETSRPKNAIATVRSCGKTARTASRKIVAGMDMTPSSTHPTTRSSRPPLKPDAIPTGTPTRHAMTSDRAAGPRVWAPPWSNRLRTS